MAISPVAVNNSYCNASYPKYLERKRQNGIFLSLAGGTTAASVGALHFTKNAFAAKHPVLMTVGAALGLLGTIGGLCIASSASKQIRNMNNSEQKTENINVEVVNRENDNNQDRSKQAINHMIKSNPMLNPMGYMSHAVNPALDSSPLDNPCLPTIA